MTSRPPICAVALLTLTLTTAQPWSVPSAHAEDSSDAWSRSCGEIVESLDEITAIADQLADQRNEAIRLAEENRGERDRCEGARAELQTISDMMAVKLADYERHIARLEAKPAPWVWYLSGVVTAVLVGGLLAFAFMQ